MSSDRFAQADVVIAGAGLSGLTLAAHLIEGGPSDLQITIIDRAFDTLCHRTFGFWGEPPPLVAPLIERTWWRLRLQAGDEEVEGELQARPYHMVRGSTLLESLLDRLHSTSRVTWLKEDVLQISNEPNGALTRTDRGVTRSRFVFESISKPISSPALLQHFGGWEVETLEPGFDPSCATLMDFQVDPEDDLAFFYVLPLTKTRALVEYTVFSTTPRRRARYDRAVRAYLEARGLRVKTVVRREYGVIPMDATPLPQKTGHVYHLGRAGGCTKPSTGYTFSSTLRQVEELARTFTLYGQPIPLEKRSGRHRFLDRVFLKVLRERPDLGPELFVRLFRSGPFDRVFRFLSEETSLPEELPLIAALPISPFAEAALGVGPARPVPRGLPAPGVGALR